MADSNHARDTYIDKEQDKFFCRLNRQRNNIDTLKEKLEQLELRVRALELANESMLKQMDSMATKLYFCTQAEAMSQVWEILSQSFNCSIDLSLSRRFTQTRNWNMRSHQITLPILKHMVHLLWDSQLQRLPLMS